LRRLIPIIARKRKINNFYVCCPHIDNQAYRNLGVRLKHGDVRICMGPKCGIPKYNLYRFSAQKGVGWSGYLKWKENAIQCEFFEHLEIGGVLCNCPRITRYGLEEKMNETS